MLMTCSDLVEKLVNLEQYYWKTHFGNEKVFENFLVFLDKQMFEYQT